MPKLFGLHNLYGALAAVLVGTLLSLLKADGLMQLLFVAVAYIGGSIVAHDVLKKRRAAHEPAPSPEEDQGTRFHHFDSRSLDRIQEERARSDRREADAQRLQPAPPAPVTSPAERPAPAPATSAQDESAPQHFDARALDRIERERQATERRDTERRDTGRRDG
ncbi:hypothetical protein QFZ52_002962 [Arthrobacter woluwensis]|uniref:hypothetical protein n=1 Tax=Arthrobacter woluwensis TaxID=156980 RepID=UPI00277E9653|nr:hypothetical protein [Arthrobacter woluwensis]MDQ0710310.1 hypothetical protein [Arthrobacter woluwensis]